MSVQARSRFAAILLLLVLSLAGPGALLHVSSHALAGGPGDTGHGVEAPGEAGAVLAAASRGACPLCATLRVPLAATAEGPRAAETAACREVAAPASSLRPEQAPFDPCSPRAPPIVP